MTAIATNNRELRELQTIEQWVQSTFMLPDECSPPPACNEYQTFTRMDLAQKRRTRTAANGLVDALDPDAVNRPAKGSRDPGALNPEDANYEEKLARSIFYCIRACEPEVAATLARQSARPWWAASILGWEGFSLDLVSGASSGKHHGEMWMGNRRRRLWKECCMRGATSVRFVQFPMKLCVGHQRTLLVRYVTPRESYLCCHRPDGYDTPGFAPFLQNL